VFIDGKNIRHLNGEKTKLDQRSTVTLVAAIAGG
jgi:molybdopterin converting factor small subunit